MKNITKILEAIERINNKAYKIIKELADSNKNLEKQNKQNK